MDTESEASSGEEEEEEEGVWTRSLFLLPLSFFFLFQQIVRHNYSLINTAIGHSVMVGSRAVNLDRKVTWPHSKNSNSCKHTHTPTPACVCVWSKYFQGDNMGIYEALYPFNKWPNNPQYLCSTKHLCFQHSMKLPADCHSKVNKW